MAHQLRVFCASERRPPLAEILTWARQHGEAFSLDPIPPVDPHRSGWREAAIRYQPGKWPFLVEAVYPDDKLLAAEVDRFQDILGRTRFRLRKRRIVKRLRRTRMLVLVEVPTYDADDRTHAAIGALVDFFAANCAGLTHVHGRGFYDRNKLLLRLD